MGGKLDQAKKIISELLKRDSNNFLHYYWMGVLSGAEAKHTEACNFYKQATELNPNDAESFFQWGISAFYSADFLKSCANFAEAIRLAPGMTEYYGWLAMVYSKLKQWDKAKEIARKGYEKSVTLYPDNKYLNSTLKNAYAGVYNEQGLMFYEQGQYSKAIIEYDEAIKIFELPVYWWNKYVAYQKDGKPIKAKESLIKALQLDPKNTKYSIELTKL